MLSLLSLASSALAATFHFHLESENPDVNGSGIFDFHFQDMINAVILFREGYDYELNTTDNRVYSPMYFDSGMVPFYFGQLSGTNDLVVEEGALIEPAYVIDNYLTINGSNSVFYTCEQLPWDPLQVGNHFGKGVAIYGANETVPSDCEPVKLRTLLY